MKIVILVDYSDKNFNKDFELANMLIGKGHHVFLAINDMQFTDLKKNCDKAVLGYSSKDTFLYADCIKLNKFSDIKDCGLF
jgi:hypothetical protein